MKQYLLLIVLLIFLHLNSFAQINGSHNRKLLSIDSNKTGLVDFKSDSEIQRLNELKSNLTPAQKKLSTDLLQLVDSRFLPKATSLEQHSETMRNSKQFKPYEQASSLSERVSEGNVYVYVYLYEGYSIYVIDGLVSEVTDRDEKNNMAVVWVKVKDLESLASLLAVSTIRTVFPSITRTGSVNTQGDGVHRTSNVRSTYGEDGTGISVGIISNGVTTRSTAQLSGDLPPDGSGLTVLSVGSGDEGTAMLEIVHDMVPGANLFFHTAGNNTVQFNTAVTNLVNAGCDIVCDDVGWITQPFYEDGTVASHISSVISSNDIIYVSSAGNAAESHYQGDFFPIVSQPTQHDFSEGDTTGYYLYLNMAVGEVVRIVLQWDDQFGVSTNDYDLYLYNLDLGGTVASSTDDQSVTGQPLEFIAYQRPTGGPSLYDYAIIVNQFSGVSVNLEVYIYAPFNYTNNIKPDDAIFGHPAVDEVVSCAAVFHSTPGTVESFSSQGPTTIEYPTNISRQTPKITGVDGVSVTGAGGFPSTFFGTSAAAPHISAILAQAWSYDLLQTGDAVRQFLYDWAVDLGTGGHDNVFEYGRGDALSIFDGVPLPVELSSFTAKVLRNGGVQLDWTTETEVDNYGFEIERAAPLNPPQGGTFGKWEVIGFVEGHGNSNSPKDYTFIDDYATYGKYAYRLKQIDTDGDFEYSDVIEINAGNIPGGFVLEQNYPNPFNPSTTIKFALAETEQAKLKVFDVLGNEVATLFNGLADGGKVYETEFEAANLSSGIYFYRLETKNRVINKKMLLLK